MGYIKVNPSPNDTERVTVEKTRYILNFPINRKIKYEQFNEQNYIEISEWVIFMIKKMNQSLFPLES